MQLFAELLRETADAKHHTLSDCLFKAKLLAARLRGRKFRSWVDAELNGYPPEQIGTLPDYRQVLVPVIGHFAGFGGSAVNNVRLETRNLPEEAQEYVEHMPIIHNVGELEAKANSGHEVFHRQLDGWVVQALRDVGPVFVSGMVLRTAENWITDANFRGVLHAIRTRLLDFLIELAAEFPDLERQNSEAAVPPDATDRLTDRVIYNNCHFNGGAAVAKQEVRFEGPVSARDIVVADRITDSFNRASAAPAPEPLKELLAQLAQAVQNVAAALGPDQQSQAADDFDTLAKEAVRGEPRESMLKAAGRALLDTVSAAGKVAEPVARIVAAVMKACGVHS